MKPARGALPERMSTRVVWRWPRANPARTESPQQQSSRAGWDHLEMPCLASALTRGWLNRFDGTGEFLRVSRHIQRVLVGNCACGDELGQAEFERPHPFFLV